MKFFVTNDLKKEHPLRVMITALLVLLALFIVSDALVKQSMFGGSVHDIYTSLMGDAENFTEPYSFDLLLEMIHTDLFFSALLFLVLAALCFRVSNESMGSKVMMLVLLVSLIVSIITPFVAINGIYSGAILWFYSFIVSHLLFIMVITHILWILWFKHD